MASLLEGREVILNNQVNVLQKGCLLENVTYLPSSIIVATFLFPTVLIFLEAHVADSIMRPETVDFALFFLPLVHKTP